jgi:hypothetical protein
VTKTKDLTQRRKEKEKGAKDKENELQVRETKMRPIMSAFSIRTVLL